MQILLEDNLALLKLLNLVSPALPVGAYAYSQGQEWAVDAQWVNTEAQVETWISGVLEHSFSGLDLPCIARLYQAWHSEDLTSVQYWNDFVLASRETHELLLEDQQLGVALSRLLTSLDINVHADILAKPSFASLFALAGVQWKVPLDLLQQGFVWSWLENQVQVAIKAVPLGQTQAQQMLQRLMTNVPEIIEHANQLADSELGAGLPALAIGSAMHERQYSRLFRS